MHEMDEDMITVNRHLYGDLLYAKGELESIQALLADREEIGTYAKVAAILDALERREDPAS